MREARWSFGQTNSSTADFSGRTGGRGVGVHENHGFATADGLGEFGCELMDTDDLDVRAGKFILQCGGGAPREAIVRAQRISVGDDQDAGHVWSLSRAWVVSRPAVWSPLNTRSLHSAVAVAPAPVGMTVSVVQRVWWPIHSHLQRRFGTFYERATSSSSSPSGLRSWIWSCIWPSAWV